jgi:hypothetical protein
MFTPRSLCGAIDQRHQWPKLYSPRARKNVEIDNNPVENAISTVVGSMNWSLS